MDALQNRVIAGFLCLLIIAVSSVVGVASTLGPMRTQAQRVFYIGEGRSNPGISVDLNVILAEAHNVTVIAERYLGGTTAIVDGQEYSVDNSGVVLVYAVHEARANLQQATGPQATYRATQELVAATRALRSVLDSTQLSDQDRNLLAGCMAEIDNRMALLNNNQYNQVAFNFNQALTRFPANILGPLAGVRPLELFE
ncbi:MAG: LemA family protein [Oscillospiraceae bacterium]|nr:LemA family protein [Oscillospiraceae bacterium]